MNNNITISAIKPELIGVIWPSVEHLVQSAVDHSNGELSTSGIKKRIISKDMILIVIYAEDHSVIAVATLEKRNFEDNKSVLLITTTGGKRMSDWISDALDVADSIAKEHGCDELYVVGRKGWNKVLKAKGFGVIHSVLSRKVKV